MLSHRPMSQTLELLPDQQERLEPFFKDEADYLKFREWYIEEVGPELERLAEARRKSEQEARQRLLR